MYVKGHSNDERCRKAVNVAELGSDIVDFRVQFGSCGLFHSDVSRSLPVIGLTLLFPGRSQLCSGHTETPKASHLQVTGVQNPLCLQYRNSRHLHRFQCLHADNIRHHRQHRTPTHLQHAHLQLKWQRHLQRRDWRQPDAEG